MKPVDQTRFGSTDGNCFAACLASVLELKLCEVPNFVLDPDNWFQNANAWCAERGYCLLWVKRDGVASGHIDPRPLIDAGHYFIVSGLSPRGDFLHCVVQHRDQNVHDPHPSREFFRGAWVDFICVIPNTLAA